MKCMFYYNNLIQLQTGSILKRSILTNHLRDSATDPGTPINHIFFAEYQLYWKAAGHLREGGGGVRSPAPSP